jgi:hypothetical protein
MVALLTGRAVFVDWKYPWQSCHINWDLAAASAELRAAMAASAKTYAWVDDCFMPNEVCWCLLIVCSILPSVLHFLLDCKYFF